MAEGRLRTTVVTTEWSGGAEGYLVRRVAAALAMSAEVTVVVADGHRGPAASCADGAFEVIRVPSQAPELRRARLLQEALTVGGGDVTAIPGPVRAELRRLGGSAPGVGQVLRSAAPDAVVVAGHRHEMAMPGVMQGRRTCLLALAVDDLALALSVAEGVGDGWDTILATNSYEADLLRSSLGRSGPALVHNLGSCLERPSGDGPGPAGWVGERSWLVALDDPGSAAVAYLALRFPALAMVVVDPGAGAAVVVRGRHRRVEAPISRRWMWELMAGAVATLDLRPAQVLPREVLESLMLGTPVVVAAASGAARRCAEEANAGLWYRDPPELAACVARMLDRHSRDALGAQGRCWATAAHANQDTFVRATRMAVLGHS
jgi:hypothetical protein